MSVFIMNRGMSFFFGPKVGDSLGARREEQLGVHVV